MSLVGSAKCSFPHSMFINARQSIGRRRLKNHNINFYRPSYFPHRNHRLASKSSKTGLKQKMDSRPTVELVDNAAPPAYEESINQSTQQSQQPQGNSGYPPQVQPTGQMQQGNPPQAYPGYPPQAYPGYPPQGQQCMPIQQQQPMPMNMTSNVTVVQNNTPVIAVFPSDNSGLAWFVCLCCFWPLGIAAIVYSSKAREAIDSGDLQSAIQFSRQSRNFSHWAIGVHVFLIITLPLIAVFAATASP